jgi:Concanavalin A-like lectin/glucanases superfamily
MRGTRLGSIGVVLALILATLATPAWASTTVGLWHMDETSGSVAHDSSGSGNDGHLQHITFASGAYAFNGTSSRVLIPDDTSLNPGTKDITISLKVKFTQKPSKAVGDYDVVRKGTDGSLYKIEISLQGRARCSFHGSKNAGGLEFGPDLSDGQWHTITCRKTATSVSGTVGSASKSQHVVIGSISNGVALALSGKSSGTQDLYKGLMNEVRITVG